MHILRTPKLHFVIDMIERLMPRFFNRPFLGAAALRWTTKLPGTMRWLGHVHFLISSLFCIRYEGETMLIRSESPDSTSSMQSLPLLTIMNQWSVKPQASRNSILRKSKDSQADATSDTSRAQKEVAKCRHGKLSPMAKMPQAA